MKAKGQTLIQIKLIKIGESVGAILPT